ncbi:MAG TPA: acyl-CoA thioesterase domain-containing protein [Acidimicrobiales bacterium]|nr:acyl-CoA thioesterase domain-containing protein [Acidimicrobiales bacterium]
MTNRFVRMLDLTTGPPGADGADHFVATPPGEGFLFGGFTMALGLQAAARTTDAAFVPKSLHTLFLRPGAWGPKLDLLVTRVNDSRSFAIRRVALTQADRTVAEVTATFHLPEPGEDRQHAELPDAPAPDTLDPTNPLLPVPEIMEIRPVTPFDRLVGETAHPYWARFPDLPADDSLVQSCAVTFVSDYMVIFTPFPKGSEGGSEYLSRTLSHSLWFHRPPVGEWLLLSSTPLTIGDGRFTSQGTVHDRQGGLVASFVQEGILRPQ